MGLFGKLTINPTNQSGTNDVRVYNKDRFCPSVALELMPPIPTEITANSR